MEQLFFPPSLPSQSVLSVIIYVDVCESACDTNQSWLDDRGHRPPRRFSLFVGYMRVCGGTGDPLLLCSL